MAVKFGTGAFDDVFVPGTTTLQTSDLADENMRRLRRLAEQSERVSLSVKPLGTHDRDFDPVVWTRLQVFGELYQLGQRYHFRAADNPARRWTLSPTYCAFLQTYGALVVRVKDADDASFDLWSPLFAAFATDEFFDALHDHRDGMWPYHDPDDYGFTQCVVFASRARVYLRGWPFDTRVQDEHGEQAIRAIEDFSADDGSLMDTLWPLNSTSFDSERVTSFDAWLEERVSAIQRAIAPS